MSMNTLAPISPDQRPPLHTADQQVAPLSPTEQAQFNQIAQSHNHPAQEAPLAPVAEPSPRGGLLDRVGSAVIGAKLGVGALGDKLRREKAANQKAPERSSKMRKALVAGAVAVVATVYLGGKAYAGTKGIETS